MLLVTAKFNLAFIEMHLTSVLFHSHKRSLCLVDKSGTQPLSLILSLYITPLKKQHSSYKKYLLFQDCNYYMTFCWGCDL